MSVINTQPLVGASGQSTGGYTIAKSLRFRRSASAYLNRTPGTAGNRQKWTWSGWVKRGLSGSANQKLFSVFNGNNDNQLFEITIFNDKLYIEGYTVYWRISTQVLRDHSSWYHIVCAVDTTLSTANDRIKVYINGTQITAFDTTNNPTQNADTAINQTAAHHIGSRTASSDFLDAYLADVYLVDGQQLTPSSFGETDSITGVWKPKQVGVTYGTNGFYLPFTDVATTSGSNAGLGKDFSGNGNYWTTNNISVTSGATYDSMKDVPTLTDADTANYAVLNPLDKNAGTIADGNLKFTDAGVDGWDNVRATIGATSGKFYWEVIPTNTGSLTFCSSVVSGKFPLGSLPGQSSNFGITYYPDGYLFKEGAGTASWGSTYTAGDVIGIALDMDSGKVWFAKNNTWQASGNPSAGTSPASSSLLTYDNTWFPALGSYYSNGSGAINCGQRPFTYTPPTGYVALNTYNLPTPTIAAGNKYMDATLYTGTLVSNAVTNAASFKPDLVWVKSRSAATDNKLTDSVRGVTKGLISNTTGAETTDTQGLTAFGSSGFTVGTNTDYNNLAATYVGWQWQAGQGTTSSNTSGSITSTVSVNTTAGFSVVTFNNPTSGAYTVGHGLGVAPKFVIIKYRSGVSNWFVYNESIGYTNRLLLNTTSASAAASYWTSAPSSTTVNFDSSFADNPSQSLVMYCWSEVSGFSKFGSYTGNGSTDGPFIYTGFRPKFILIKNINDGGAYWNITDSVRGSYNVDSASLYPNVSDAEGTSGVGFDFLSNGFKVRNAATFLNTSGHTMIYMAFAENPFKYALAR